MHAARLMPLVVIASVVAQNNKRNVTVWTVDRMIKLSALAIAANATATKATKPSNARNETTKAIGRSHQAILANSPDKQQANLTLSHNSFGFANAAQPMAARVTVARMVLRE